MSSRLLKLAAVVILLTVLLHPLVESLDTWDGAGPANDTEAVLLGIVLGIGLLLALRRVLTVTLELAGQADGVGRSRAAGFFPSPRVEIYPESLSLHLVPLRI